MSKNDFLDNGLTEEQQEVLDEAYETLMSEVKVIDLKLYERLRANELSLADVYRLRNSKNVDIKIDEKEQYNLFLGLDNVFNGGFNLHYLD